MNDLLIIAFQIITVLFSIIIHEVSHGFVAYLLGDRTAKEAGRLNLNPIKHIDLWGSIFLPISFYVVSGGAFIFGWAKPVPYNPYNLKNPKVGSGLIAAAGPASNFLLALVASLLLYLDPYLGGIINPIFLIILIKWNVSLMVFNLIPLPPLDGSKILFSLLPGRFSLLLSAMERFGLPLIIIFILFGSALISPVFYFFYKLFVPAPFWF